MDDRQNDEAGKPRGKSFVTERELLRVLDESLWQVERRRVNPDEQSEPQGT